MEEHNALTFTPVEHPNPQVRQVGFDLEHPYVERCWSAVVGPSSMLLLRRVAALWVDDAPARQAPVARPAPTPAPAPVTRGKPPLKAVTERITRAAKTYLSNGNAAIDSDWAEF